MSFRNLWLRMVRLYSFVMHTCNTFFLSCSLLLYIYTSLIMPHKKADKENSNPLSPHTVWNTTCNNILVDCLVVQRKNSKIPSNGPSEWGIGQPLPVMKKLSEDKVLHSELSAEVIWMTYCLPKYSIWINIFKGFQYLLIILPPTFAQWVQKCA